MAAAQQAELQEQKLIEHQTATAPIEAFTILRRMQRLRGFRQCRQLESPLQLSRKGIGPGGREGQDLINQAAETVSTNPFGEGVHRQKTTDAGGLHRR